ncbi:MAG TPA: RodZ domain-containing protein [Gallionella sp.]|nr:RodZ domain-containing protein [Gallionella sp.]
MNTNEGAAMPVLPGAGLREARERLGLSVADAADQTKLAPRQIEALEADDFAHLPEMAFVRGFVRSYAKILQLDPQPLLAMLPQAIASGAAQVTRSSVEVPFPNAHSPRVQNLVWLGAALFLSVLVVVFAVWHYTSPRSQPEPEKIRPVEMAIPLPVEAHVVAASEVAEASAVAEPEAIEPTPPVNPVTPAPVQPVTLAKPVAAQPAAIAVVKPVLPVAASAVKATQSAAAATKPAVAAPAAKPLSPVAPPAAKPLPAVVPSASSAPTVLRLTFGEESWAEVRDAKGNIVSSQINPAGSELNLKGQGPFSLVVGHASTSRLFHKGKQIDLTSHASANSDVARLTLE